MTEKKDIFTIRRDTRRQLIEDFLRKRYAPEFIQEDYEDENTKIWKIRHDDTYTYDAVTHVIEKVDGKVVETLTVSVAITRPFVTELDGTKKWKKVFDRLHKILDRIDTHVGNMKLYLTLDDDIKFFNEWGMEVWGGFVSINAELEFGIGDVVDVGDFLAFTLNDEFTMVILDFLRRQFKPLKKLWDITEELADYYSPKWGVYPPD